MKKNLLLGLLAMLLPLTGAAATASLSIEDLSIKAGEEKEMVINLTNPNDIITLVQFDLSLPAGLSIKKVDGDYDIDIAGRTTWKKHSLDANAQADGSIRFLMASSSNTALSGTEGAIIKMTLIADGTFNKGDIKLDNILLVTPEEKEIAQSAITYSIDNSTPVPPPTPGTAKLSIEPFSIPAGGEAEMVIDLTNPDDAITLVQFDLSLPAGLSIKKVEGDYDIDIAGRTTWKKHSLDANAQADGSIRFLMASSSNTALSGTEGAIIKMTLIADNSFTEGNVKLDNILLVTPEEKESQPEAYTYHVVPPIKDDVTLTARNYTRIYGSANPTFEYIISEGTITSGEPAITCSATATSPVGTYDIVISKGSVSNGTVNLINGTLTITKAPLTVKAGSYTRQEGEENPTFTITYEGFKNGETEEVLTQKPVATTTATKESAPGDYPITVSGGTAENYSFDYIDGVLTITKKPTPPSPGTSKLSIEPFSIPAGGEAEMVINLTNPDDAITLVQFDLSLPAGISIKKVDGDYDIDIAGRTTWKKHSLDANAQADGCIRFLMASSSNTALSGTEGAIIKMTLIADNSFTEGDIKLDNILLVTPEEKESQPEAYTYHVVPPIKDDVTLTAKSYTRVYGDTNPTFEFTVSEGTITSGEPAITCSATATSPVGTYDIVISKGSVSNGTVDLVNGTLTITKAPLTVKAGSYTRQEGEENPTFTITYEGFKNGETEEVLTQKPVATTTATKTSAPGDYPITISGGSAKNYEFKYVNGVLTVTNIPNPWVDIIVNGNMEGESMECFYITEQDVGGPFVAVATDGIGKNGGKAVKVQSQDNPAQDWDTQFFIRLPYQLPAGTKFKVSFDYKADKAGDFDTQAHTEPGGYIHWACIGSGSFTTEWQTYEKEGSISADMSKEGQVMQTIAFNLAKNKAATEFIFDNVKFEVEESVLPMLAKNPAVNPTPYPVGIISVNADKQDGLLFDLQGRRVAIPRKGLYIIDGKKMVVK